MHHLYDLWIAATAEFQVSKRDRKGSFINFTIFNEYKLILTKHIAIMVANGTIKHMIATFLHGNILPSRNTTKNPKVAAIPAQAVKIPRIDGSLKRMR